MNVFLRFTRFSYSKWTEFIKNKEKKSIRESLMIQSLRQRKNSQSAEAAIQLGNKVNIYLFTESIMIYIMILYSELKCA